MPSPMALFATLGAAMLCLCYLPSSVSGSNVDYKVKCNPDSMEVDIVKGKNVLQVYLDKFHVIPECRVHVDGRKAYFKFDFHAKQKCGLTKIFNAFSGRTVYQHKIVVETSTSGSSSGKAGKKTAGDEDDEEPSITKEVIPVKCDFTVLTPADPAAGETNGGGGVGDPVPFLDAIDEGVRPELGYAYEVHQLRLRKRQALPPGFEEPDVIELTGNITGEAPVPELSVAVTQNGLPIGEELSVRPGSPLAMSIRLDDVSAPTYGIKVSLLGVTDTRGKNETIVFDGCSVDTHLFENFVTDDGNAVTARFRAFKFPESTYVEFQGIVDVCINLCEGSVCSNRQVAYGRKRRSLSEKSPYIYQVSMSTIIAVADADGLGLHRAALAGSYVKRDAVADDAASAGSLGVGSVRYLEPASQVKEDPSEASERAVVTKAENASSIEDRTSNEAASAASPTSRLAHVSAHFLLTVVLLFLAL